MDAPLLEELRNLSSGTIASLSRMRTYEEIEALQNDLVKRAGQWIKRGIMRPNDSWCQAWNRYHIEAGITFPDRLKAEVKWAKPA